MTMPSSPHQAPTGAMTSNLPLVRTISLIRPLHWLQLGWQDTRQCGWLSLMHGAILAGIGAMLLFFGKSHFWFLAGAFSGFLLVAPVLATSLYALSRALERGEPANPSVVFKAWLNWQNNHVNKWSPDYWRLVQFGVLLALAGTGWVITSAALITLLAPEHIDTPMQFLRQVVLAKEGFLFEMWLVMGGILAAPIFASSVIAIPLLLDRQATLGQAVLTSWQVVLSNPIPMAFWATLIMVITLLGMGLAMVGLVITMPVLGHASWHAYRDLVDTSTLPGREPR